MLLKKIRGKSYLFTEIAVPASEGYEMVPAFQLKQSEANDNNTNLILKSKHNIVACRTLKEMEEQLKDFLFFVRVDYS
ncbi:MAG: hypothetical protein ACSLE0_00150 [Chitinophagaceae bacterium]